MGDDVYYDPYDYEIDANPYGIWKRMRDEAPLYYNDKFDFYAASRHADVRDMSVDWQTYSSGYGSVLEIIKNPAVLEQIRNMLFEDPPIHDIHRSIINRALTPRRVSDLEPRVRELCARFLDPYVGSAGFDFVQDFGTKIPMLVIGSLLGVPEEDQEMIRTLAALTHADIDTRDGGTRKLDDHELLNFINLIAAAGNETVARLMGWAGLLLSRHSDQRRILVDDPSAIPGAVEELLRYEAPSPVQARRVMRDVEAHGQAVPEGSVHAEVPPGAGTIVGVEWDFDGSGTYPYSRDVDAPATQLTLSTTHRYDRPGTYFATARVHSHREGDVRATTRRIPNVGQARVVVS
jgi:cytochrome P450